MKKPLHLGGNVSENSEAAAEPSPAVAVSVEHDPTPLVGLIAGGLRRRLAEPEFASRTKEITGVGVIRDNSTPQAVNLRLAAGSVTIEHGAAEDADATLVVDLAGGESEPEVSGAEKHGELVEFLEAVLEPPAVDWHEAAEGFWRVARARPGAPSGLLVRETESDEIIVFGAEKPAPYEIHGTAEALSTVFVGQLPLTEAVVQGTVFVRGGMVDLSILAGACFAIMIGGADA
jgi:hypothetical protein